MKIAIFKRKENKEIVELLMSEAKKYRYSFDEENPDIVFCVGGDGTFLRAVHKYLDKLDKIKFIGINSGTLGFFYDFCKEDIPSIFKMLEEKEYILLKQRLLKGVANYNDEEMTFFAVNEIRLENPFRTIITDVSIDDEKLERYRGNGLIVCSPLGSSAYNKSLGGAIIDHDLEVLELTEVAGIQNNVTHSLGSSLILKGDKTIIFEGELVNSVVGYDFASYQKQEVLKKLSISYSDKEVKVIASKEHSYIKKIKRSFVA